MAVIGFIWRNVPVFLIWFIGLGMLNNSLHHISPSIEIVRFLSFFPLVTSLVLLWFACRNDYGSRRMTGPFYLWASGMTLLYITPFMHGTSMPLDVRTQLLLYELSSLIQLAMLFIHGRIWFSGWDRIWVFGVTLLFGVILENGGIILGVFTEPGYLLYIPGLPAPLATAFGWTSILYCGFFAVERLLPHMSPIGKGLVCALIGLSLDLSIDPVATRLGWWIWDPDLEVKIWEVPAINFIAWFWALFPYATIYYWMRGMGRYGEMRKVFYFMGSFPVILTGEFLGVIATLVLAGDNAALLVIGEFFSSLGLP